MLNLRTTRHDCRALRLDANETSFLTRQLEYLEPQVYKVLYVENSAFKLFPMSSAAGPAAQAIRYRTSNMVGKAKIIASFADDLPKVGVFRGEFPSPIRSLGASYGWSLQDIRSAMMAGVSLERDDAEAAVKAHNDETNRIAWFGDDAYGLPGLKSNTDIPSTGAVTGNWISGPATADQMVADVNEMLVAIINGSNGVERANTVAMPPAQLARLMSTARSTTTDMSVLGFLQASWPGVTFTDAFELKDWTTDDDAMIAYRRDESKLYLAVPQPYEEMPIERHALRFEVATHSRVGGLIVRYPKSIAIRTGLR